MVHPIVDFLKKVRRTLRGTACAPGRGGHVLPAVYILVRMRDPFLDRVLDSRYRILARVGSGAMSVVYKAEQQPIGREVAVKILKRQWAQDPLTVKRFLREAKTVAALSHPNIMLIMDVGSVEEGQPYFVCEFLEGESLESLLEREGSLGPDRAVSIFRQVCDAMQEAHRQGLIHRDLKPGNIMLLKQADGSDFVKLVDFGIAKVSGNEQAVSQRLTLTGEIWGSPAYMSPEQCLGYDLDGRSDIYSLGTVLYESVTGKVPFAGKNVAQIIVKQLNEKPPPFASHGKSQPAGGSSADVVATAEAGPLLAALERTVFKALEKKADDRFQSMAEFGDALSRIRRTAKEEGDSTPRSVMTSTTGSSQAAVRADRNFPASAANQAGKTVDAVKQTGQEKLNGSGNAPRGSPRALRSRQAANSPLRPIVFAALLAAGLAILGAALAYFVLPRLAQTPGEQSPSRTLGDLSEKIKRDSAEKDEPERQKMNLAGSGKKSVKPVSRAGNQKPAASNKHVPSTSTDRVETNDQDFDTRLLLRKQIRDEREHWMDFKERGQAP